MTKEIQISRIVLLTTKSGFFKAYEENVPKSRTYLEAYELTEQEYESIFDCRRYSSYDSFRVVYGRR